jgi:hypothetical protein
MNPFTITIPAAGNAAGVATVHCTGKYFLVTALDGAFQVLTSTHDEYDFSETGSGFGNDVSPTFGKLTFYNKSGAPVTITFYVSLTPIKTPDVNVTSTVSVTTVLQNTLAGCVVEPEGQAQVNTAVIGLAVPFAAGGNYFRHAIIIAQKSLDRAANTGKVYIGNSNVHQPIALAPGDTWTIDADVGGKRDFGSWYVSADNAGDGVSILYV